MGYFDITEPTVFNFHCIGCTCGKDNEGIFEIEIESRDEIYHCPNDNSIELKAMGMKILGGIITGVHAKGRTDKEKEKRRLTDFKKNTLETLGGDEKKYFEKKLKDKGI